MNKLTDISNRVVRKIRREGYLNTIAQLGLWAESFWFDVRYGVDTHRKIGLGRLNISSPTVKFGRGAQSTFVRHMRKVLDEIRPSASDVLVDFGCGKGRVLLIAAKYGFKRVVGIEFSKYLCSIARENIRRMQKKTSLCPIEVICNDASLYDVRPDETVFFFFNPFESVVMNKVIRKIEDSFDQHPRRISIVYLAISSQRIGLESGRFKLVRDSHLNGLPFQIYELGWQLP